MRIGEWSYDVMFYGALAVAVIAVLVIIGMLEGRRNGGVPSARVVNATVDADVVVAKARPAVGLLAAVGVLIVMVGAALWMHSNRTDVIVVSDAGDGARATRYVQFSDPDGMPLAHRHTGDDLFTEGQVWIVNGSHHDLRIDDVSYGMSLGFGSEPKIIPPGTMDHTHRVDYVGPDDAPPKEVTTSSGLNFDIRTWLTWDR